MQLPTDKLVTPLWKVLVKAAILGCLVLLSGFLLWDNHFGDDWFKVEKFGYIPWEGGPRFEFDTENECWRHLAIAKQTNAYLLSKSCTKGSTTH